MPSENHTQSSSSEVIDEVAEPSQRVRELSEKAAQVSVDDSVPIKRYWRSGKELMRMATIYRDEGQLDKAFILYMKYITLFVEKILSHCEYRNADAADKSLAKANCKMVLPIAEELKKKLMVKYQYEYDIWIKEKERRDAEEEALLAKMRLESERRREEEEAKRLAEVQHKLDAKIESARERQNTSLIPSAPLLIDNNYKINLIPIDSPKTMPPTIGAAIGMPSFDRSNKPSASSLSPLSSYDDKNDSDKLHRIIIPQGLAEKFLIVAKDNTLKNVETCAILAGKYGQNAFTITHVLVPSQIGTPDSCITENEEEMFHIQDEYDLMTLGWIHTHPTQSAFMSSIDLHTHCSYQLMLPEAIAIVCAPKYDQIGVFSLTPSYGLNFVAQCRLSGFHPHPKDPPLYNKSGHVIFDDTIKVTLIDLR